MNQLHRPLRAVSEFRTRHQKRQLGFRLPELVELERILSRLEKSPVGEQANVRVIETIEHHDQCLPIYAIDLGNQSKQKPSLLITAGVHGIERIGSRVAIALLNVWLQRMSWDRTLEECFKHMSVTIIPIVNPVGMMLNRRANGAGVDLMRNAPIDAEGAVPFLVSGQRFSKWLPWFRGDPYQLERENQALEKEVKRLTESSPLTISLDCHSGFGFTDRIWFPYAYRRRPMSDIAPIVALKLLWENSYPDHHYIFEPQSNHYQTHGDLWDYFYKKFGRTPRQTFLPLTLELGSWIWVKKRPTQLFRFEGLFNPMVPHRQRRTLRKHLPLMDFLRNAVGSFDNWLPDDQQKSHLQQMANSFWYREH